MTERISTDRLIAVLGSVNCTAIENDEGRPGAYLAKVCHAAAERLKELHLVEQKALALADRKKPIRVVKTLKGQLDLVEYIETQQYRKQCAGYPDCTSFPCPECLRIAV